MMIGSASSDETMVEDIQVQNSEGKEINSKTLYETRSSTTLSDVEMSNQAIQNVSVDLDLHWRNMIFTHNPYGLLILPTFMKS